MAEGNIRGASLNPIYSQLRNAQDLNVGEVNTFTDWSVEAGDVVTVTRDGQEYKMPVHNQKTNWNKQQRVMISATGNEKRESITKVSQKKFRGGGSGLQATRETYQSIITHYNEMVAGLVLESSSASLFVENKYTQMRSGLDLTSSSAALYVENKYSQMKSGLDLTSSSAALYVENKYTQMSSGLKLTSSSAALYVNDKYSQMSSGLKLTSSSASLYVNNKYTQMSSGLKLTSSSAALYVENKYTQMSSGLKLTSSSAALYVNDKYSQMSSGLKLTSSSASLYVNNKYTQMQAGLKLTESSAFLYTRNAYTQMSSGLKLTESSAFLYTRNAYTQMSSGLKLTSDSAALYVNNAYTQMQAGLILTSNSASLYVKNTYDQMKSGLDLASNSASLYVNNMYAQMKSGLDLASNSATLYVKNKTTKAQLLLAINGAGKSTAYLEADVITLDGGTTKISDVLTVLNGTTAVFTKPVIVGNGAQTVSINNGSVRATDDVRVYSGNDYQTIDFATLSTTIKSAEVVGNQLKLTQYNGTEITFNKAVTQKIKGTWSGGQYTVVEDSASGSAPPIGTIIGLKGVTWNSFVGTVSVGYEDPISGNMVATGCVFDVTCPNPYSHTFTAKQATGYQADRHINLYYKDNNGQYHAAGDSGAKYYWYFSSTDLNQTGSFKTFRY